MEQAGATERLSEKCKVEKWRSFRKEGKTNSPTKTEVQGETLKWERKKNSKNEKISPKNQNHMIKEASSPLL